MDNEAYYRSRGLVSVIIPPNIADAVMAFSNREQLDYDVVVPEHGARTSRVLWGPPWLCALVHGCMKIRDGSFHVVSFDLALQMFSKYIDLAVVDSVWRLHGDNAAFKIVEEYVRDAPDVKELLHRMTQR